MTVIHKIRLLQVVKGSIMLRQEIIGRENRSTYLSGNKKHMKVKSHQFIKLTATFSVKFLTFFAVAYACCIPPKSYAQIITMRSPQRRIGM